jgi:hypothetical protein
MNFPRFPAIFAFMLLSAAASFGLEAAVIDNAFIQKQFGSTCTLLDVPPLRGDLNGDGIEDVVIAARCKNPLIDEGEDNFKVIDPFASFFGYGDPKIATQFATDIPERRGVSLLIIHGVGPEAWQSPTPGAKFVIIDLPFKQISLRKMKLRKKSVTAIYIEETGADQMTSALIWDGKKYRYVPLGANME